MKRQIDQLKIMSKALEHSGFTEEQPAAIIETVALAIETFGVTPEILDDRIGKVMEQLAEVRTESKQDIADVKTQGQQQFEILLALIKANGADTKANSADIKSLQQSVDGLKQGMLDHQRSMFRIMMTFMVALLAAVLGVIGVLTRQLPSL